MSTLSSFEEFRAAFDGLNCEKTFSALERLIAATNLKFSPLELFRATTLNLAGKISHIPPEIGCLTNLEVLLAGNNELTSLPEELGDLFNLKELHLNKNNLRSLPKNFDRLKNLRRLDLSGNLFVSFPRQITLLHSLVALFLFDCASLNEIPCSILNLKALEILSISGTDIPITAGTLILSPDRVFSDLPYTASIVNLKSLKHLYFAGRAFHF